MFTFPLFASGLFLVEKARISNWRNKQINLLKEIKVTLSVCTKKKIKSTKKKKKTKKKSTTFPILNLFFPIRHTLIPQNCDQRVIISILWLFCFYFSIRLIKLFPFHRHKSVTQTVYSTTNIGVNLIQGALNLHCSTVLLMSCWVFSFLEWKEDFFFFPSLSIVRLVFNLVVAIVIVFVICFQFVFFNVFVIIYAVSAQ